MVYIAATIALFPSLVVGSPFSKRSCPPDWPTGPATIRVGGKYLDRGLASNNGTFFLTTYDQAGVFAVEPCLNDSLQEIECIVRR